MNKVAVTVLIVDDHDLVRSGMRYMLQEETGVKVIGEAASGEEALEFLRKTQPNVVLLDMQMPGIGGIETTRKICHLYPDVKVLVVSVCEDNISPVLVMQIGASGYVTKGASKEEMIMAISLVLKGRRYLSPAIALDLALKHIDEGSKSPMELLSEREKQIALMIADGKRAKDIANKLHLSSKTVNSYRYRIFDKLKIKGDVDLVRFLDQYRDDVLLTSDLATEIE